MDLAQAVQHAESILDEEGAFPTVDYIDPIVEWNNEIKNSGGQYSPPSPAAQKAVEWARKRRGDNPHSLYHERSLRPRPVHESPYDFVFKSDNFEMLRGLFNQLSPDDRSDFVSSLLAHIPVARGRRPAELRFPCHQHQMCELPLVAEFSVRVGRGNMFFSSLAALEQPTLGVLLMMLEIEEMIALNFTLFSVEDLSEMESNLTPLLNTCTKIATIGRVRRVQNAGRYSPEHVEVENLATEVQKSIKGIGEECRKARYFYLRDQLLQETPNLEIYSDKSKVIGYLTAIGFSPVLTASLNRAEEQFRSATDQFDWKDCLGNIRSFYEHMTIEGGQAFAKSLGKTCVDKWDTTVTFLRNYKFFTEQQDKFARGLYTLLSDEGVHPLIAEREFARLLRNMVIEYGVMFLTMLEKRGIKI